jgi:hypothetical protein
MEKAANKCQRPRDIPLVVLFARLRCQIEIREEVVEALVGEGVILVESTSLVLSRDAEDQVRPNIAPELKCLQEYLSSMVRPPGLARRNRTILDLQFPHDRSNSHTLTSSLSSAKP